MKDYQSGNIYIELRAINPVSASGVDEAINSRLFHVIAPPEFWAVLAGEGGSRNTERSTSNINPVAVQRQDLFFNGVALV